jgi:hypothetical protein
MHKNVNINNKMLSFVFYRVIKAAIIAEKNFITRVQFKYFHSNIVLIITRNPWEGNEVAQVVCSES